MADKLEEHWTPTTIEATFALRDLPACTTRSRPFSIPLPLRSHEWTFALSLAPERRTNVMQKSKSCNWALTAFSFNQNDTQISWGDTAMRAELELYSPGPDRTMSQSDFDSSDDPTSRSWPVSLGAITVSPGRTPSAERQMTTPRTLPSKQSIRVSLSITISNCPLAHGFFQAQSVDYDTEVQRELFRQCGDRVLGRSLTTGRIFDVKFLSSPTRFPSGSAAKLFPTYVSLSVVEDNISLSDFKLNDGWTAALKTEDDSDDVDSLRIKEILCPSEYEYELDSDYDDEDDASTFVEPDVSLQPGELFATMWIVHPHPVCMYSGATDKQPESSASGTSGSLSSFDLGSVDGQLDEIIQDSGVQSHLFPAAAIDCERAVLVKFAAYKTWHAFLWYCYTGRVKFSELKSQSPGVRRQRVTHIESGPPSCSPKSMYRLADLVGNEDLKEKSLKAIETRLTEVNVLDEILSVFTSKYPDVRKLQLDVLVGYCKSPEVKKRFLKTVMNHHNLPHVEPVISAFYDRLVASNKE